MPLHSSLGQKSEILSPQKIKIKRVKFTEAERTVVPRGRVKEGGDKGYKEWGHSLKGTKLHLGRIKKSRGLQYSMRMIVSNIVPIPNSF